MTIEYLADHLEFLSTLAEWQHDEWGYLSPGDSVEARKARLRGFTERDGIPLTVVAHEEGELLGSASLIPHDMKTRLELTPWLAGVFVAPEHRRRGIGGALVRRIMVEAGALNIPALYLYTVHSETFYASLGWSLQEHTAYREQNVAIMTYRRLLSMTSADFRKIALSMPEACESEHMAHPDFRVGNKSSLRSVIRIETMEWSSAAGGASEIASLPPKDFFAAKGAWGKRGSTCVRLKAIDKRTLQAALEIAWRRIAPGKEL